GDQTVERQDTRAYPVSDTTSTDEYTTDREGSDSYSVSEAGFTDTRGLGLPFFCITSLTLNTTAHETLLRNDARTQTSQTDNGQGLTTEGSTEVDTHQSGNDSYALEQSGHSGASGDFLLDSSTVTSSGWQEADTEQQSATTWHNVQV